MTYADDWQEIKGRYSAWWNGTLKAPLLKAFVMGTPPVLEGQRQQRYTIQPDWHSEAVEHAVKYGMSPAPLYVGLG